MSSRIEKIKKYESDVCRGNSGKKLFGLDDWITMVQKKCSRYRFKKGSGNIR